MKKMIFILAAVLMSTSISFASHHTSDKDKNASAKEPAPLAVVLKGQVTDSETSESLTGVALEIVGTKLVVYTDFDGNFTISDLEPGHYSIVIKYVSYQGHLIENVYLQQGINTLQPIKLVAN